MQTNGNGSALSVPAAPAPVALPSRPPWQPAAALGQLAVLLLTLATAGLQLSVVYSLRETASELAAERRAAAAQRDEDAERERLLQAGREQALTRQAESVRITEENLRLARELNKRLKAEE